MNDPAASVAAAVDPGSLVELVLEAVRIPSVTPNEGRFAEWLKVQLESGGWGEVDLVEAAPGRPNLYARTGDGQAEGRSLVLAGHLDTVHADDWVTEWKDSAREDPFAGHFMDGEIWARGVTDQKGGVCSVIEAIRAIHRAGYRLRGPVIGLFVCDEESGQPGSGLSLGMRTAVQDLFADVGSPPDFAIYTEPTTGAIYTAQMGFLIADITLVGKSAYFGRPELGVDALKAGHALLGALWDYNDTLSGAAHRLLGERFLLVTTVGSGGNIAVPGHFELSLIQKLLPGDDLDKAASVLREITAGVAEESGVSFEVTFSAPRDHSVGGTPDEIPADHAGVEELARAIEETTGGKARIEGAPYWSEKPLLRSVGIPGVYFAAGDIATCHTPFERLPIEEFVSLTRTLAYFVASWCGVEKSAT
ncbi:MAG: M20 family metallopeptidase [bacterium]|nr:M20 family metallopeptidase [Acidimicrobiia bacterium]MCY4650177.1 M20 family metallopeptidase [bacterium]